MTLSENNRQPTLKEFVWFLNLKFSLFVLNGVCVYVQKHYDSFIVIADVLEKKK
jgi:hypothetical protein